MTENHPLLVYHSDDALYEQIMKFLEDGIASNERCVLLTSQNDGDKIYQNLKNNCENNKVVKLFSYFSVPDPSISPNQFEEKMNKLMKLILNDTFRGRIAFNVLCDVSRFSSDTISKIEKAEKYLHSISSSHTKFLCTYKTGIKNDSLTNMLKIGFENHDHIIQENDDSETIS